ncbi:MAG: UvrD-helicase domain-containing protein [Acidaminococcaceae bacterium]
MTDFTPAQECAINTIENNISVSAGAGSGKTRVLVERFVNIIAQQKANADGILAITFTRKAAKEMRERVRAKLNILIKNTANERNFWQKQLILLERAQISTIDGFCSRLLRDNPVEAQIDPSFVTTEEFDLNDFYYDESLAYMKKLLQNKDSDFQKLLNEYGRPKLLEMINSLMENLLILSDKSDLPKPYIDVLGEGITETKKQLLLNLELLMDIRETIKGKHRDELDLIAANLNTVKEAVEHCRIEILSSYLMTLSARNKSDADLVKEIRDLTNILLMTPIDRRAADLIGSWQIFIRGLEDYFKAKKIERKILSFADVEEKALQLLLNNKDILGKCRNRYKYVMVDEFQDTNLLQKKLVYLLAGGDSEKLLDNRLFVVGDAKQSIYRFRGAEVSVFANVCKDIEKNGGKNVTLADNFRSSPEILEVCNEVFKDLMGYSSNDEVIFEELRPNRETQAKPKLLIITAEKDKVKDANKAETYVVAESIKKLVDEEHLKYGDIAILLASINKAQSFAAALRINSIPFHIIDGKGFFEKQEIIDLINLLSVLDNSRRDLELIGVLRSPYFGLSDDTITELCLARENNSLWHILINSNLPSDELLLEQQILLQRACEKLKKLRANAQTLPLHDLLIRIFDSLQIAPLLIGQEFGEEKLANVKKLQLIATEFCMKQGGTLHTFLQRVKKMRETETRIEVSNGSFEQDSVTIMTIHKSKGLEFPVVFLPALHARGRYDSRNICFLSDIGLGIKVLNEKGELVESSVFRKIKQYNSEMETSEKKRQLYVAMTRAEKRLFLSGVSVSGDKEQKSREDWLDSLKRILLTEKPGKSLIDIEVIEENFVKRQDVALIEKHTEIISFNERVYEQIKPLTEFGVRHLVFSATSLLEYERCPRSFFYQYIAQLPGSDDVFFDRDSELCRGGLPANILGIVIHAAMENIEQYGLNEALNYAIEKYVPENMHLKAREDAYNMLSSYLSSALYQEISSLNKKTEDNFCLPLVENGSSEFWFTGSIDCLYTYPEGDFGIIDYKTGKPPEKESDIKGYAEQLALYVLAAERLYGKTVRTAELHFLQNNSKWELPINREAALNQIIKKCIAVSNKKEEQDFAVLPEKCAFCSYAYLCPQK